MARRPRGFRVIVFALGTVTASATPPGDLGASGPESVPRVFPVDRAGPTGRPPGSGAGAPAPVVGGSPAISGEWDDAVALYTPNDQFACSGVLIAPDLVLTAGHCGAGLGGIVVGTTNLRRGGEKIRIVETIVHPDYYTTFDAAILVLEHPASEVEPRVMALDCIAEDYVAAGAPVVIVGFGATDEWANDWTTALQQGFTTITDPLCADLTSGCYERVSPGGELIAGGDGVDSCAGDSGGPLYLTTPDDGDYLVGITSRAKVPADTPCGGGGIYVRVDALVEWIEETTGRTLVRPECDGRNRVPYPKSNPIEVVHGATAVAVIDANDPDGDQEHTYRIVRHPNHGLAQMDPDGAVYYLAPNVFVGDDSVLVEVTDNGEPPLTGELEIPILVLPAERGAGITPGGCSTAPAGGGAALLLLGWRVSRRRRP